MSARRFGVLTRGIPLDSALGRSIDPKRLARGWKTEHELLAVIAELLDTNNRLFIVANSKRGTRLPRPIFIRRPDDMDRPKPTPGATRRWMAARGIPVIRKPRKKKETSAPQGGKA